MYTLTNKFLSCILLLLLLPNGLLPAFSTINFQGINISGKFAYKTYREGKGGFVNSLEISKAEGGRFHVSFEGTYLYLAGTAETFHEGSGEGVGQLKGNVLTANLNDGVGGTCRLTITFSANTATVKPSSICQLNVNPAGVYRKERVAASKPVSETGMALGSPASQAKGHEICSDPKAPCPSRARKFEAYELPFRLPASLRPNREYKSVPFYGIIIKTFDSEDCDADDYTASIERERIRIQKVYSTRKVFGSYSCPNMDALNYDFPGLMDASGERALITAFIGVYAGKTSAEAEEFLIYVKTLYPQAVLKPMTVSYSMIVQ